MINVGSCDDIVTGSRKGRVLGRRGGREGYLRWDCLHLRIVVDGEHRWDAVQGWWERVRVEGVDRGRWSAQSDRRSSCLSDGSTEIELSCPNKIELFAKECTAVGERERKASGETANAEVVAVAVNVASQRNHQQKVGASGQHWRLFNICRPRGADLRDARHDVW